MGKHDSIHFYTDNEARQWAEEYLKYSGQENSRAQRAAMQFYMSEFMYLPNTLIADIMGRKPWHVNQTIQRLTEAAEMSRVPVTMNDAYQEFIEDMDDFSRENYSARNPEISMVLDQKVTAWIRWSAQKASGWFEDSELEPEQTEMIDELLRTIGLPAGGWMGDLIAENYKILYHD